MFEFVMVLCCVADAGKDYGNMAPGSADRRQSLSRLAPVVEEPGSTASVDASGDVFGSWRASAAARPMQLSLIHI